MSKEIRNKIKKLVHDYCSSEFIVKEFVPGKTVIPPSGKLVGETEIEYMVEAALDGWLTAGRFNDQFQEKLSNYIGVKYALTVNSGSSANLVAFMALTSSKLGSRAIKMGDEIICVAAGFPTTVNPIMQFGAIPVFFDIDINTYNIKVDNIEAHITKKTKAVMLAHTLGNPFNLKVIKEICDKYGLWLIEDCCDALGSLYEERRVGTYGDIGTLSFYPAHHITMGEGGAVFTSNKELIEICESFRDWGRDCYCPPGKDNTCGKRYCWKLGNLPLGYDHKYIYSHMGYNLKITDMQAACGLAQIEKVNQFVQMRKQNFEVLYENLEVCSKYITLPQASSGSDPSWFGFPVTLTELSPVSRSDLLAYLNQEGIGTRLLFAGNLIHQPYMSNKNYIIAENLKNTDIVMRDTFWIGLHPSLSKEMLIYSSSKIKEFLGCD